MSSAMYVFDPTDTSSGRAPGSESAGAFGPNAGRGGKMTKTQVNTFAKHVAIAAVVVWAVTKFV